MLKRKRDEDEIVSTDPDNFDFGEDFDEKVENEGQPNLDDGLSNFQIMEPHLHQLHQLHHQHHLQSDSDHHLIHHRHLLHSHRGVFNLDQSQQQLLLHEKSDDMDENLLLKTNPSTPTTIPWTEEEDFKLTEAIDLYVWGNPPTIDWEKVSEHVETFRTAEQCAKRWNTALKYRRPEFRSLPWTKQEDELLEFAVQQYEGQGLRGGVNWEKVRTHVGEIRTANQCRGRWNGILKHRTATVSYSPWSEAEDKLLIEAIAINGGQGRKGATNWTAVSLHMGGIRTAQQCSHRWNRVIQARGIPATLHPWTDEEDNKLRDAAMEFYGQGLRGGVDWQKVAQRMDTGRTPQQYGHRWNRVVKLKGAVNKNTPWTREEDERLMEAVFLFEGQGLRGAVDWGRVVEFMGGDRTSQQCCHRWSGVLKHRGAAKFTPWTPEEDDKLTEAVHLYQNQGLRGGVSWGKVSDHLNRERSCQQCAHRWNRVLSHRMESGTLNTTEYSEEEDNKLREAVLAYQGRGWGGGVDWGKVATQFENTRTPQQLCTRWNRVLKNHQHVKPLLWTEMDDQKLIEAVNLFRGHGRGGKIDWLQVGDYVGGGRTREQNCGRWNGVLKHRYTNTSTDVTQVLNSLPSSLPSFPSPLSSSSSFPPLPSSFQRGGQEQEQDMGGKDEGEGEGDEELEGGGEE